MPEPNDSPPEEKGSPPSEPPKSEKNESDTSELHRLMQETLSMMQVTQGAMSTRVEQIEAVQQQQSEKLTAALEEAAELAAVYREQISQHDNLVQKMASLQAREERQLAVLVKLSQQAQESDKA